MGLYRSMTIRTTEEPCVRTTAPYVEMLDNVVTVTSGECEHSDMLVRVTPVGSGVPEEFIYSAPFSITEDCYISAWNVRAGYKIGDDGSGKLFEYEPLPYQEPFWIKSLSANARNNDGTVNPERQNSVWVPGYTEPNQDEFEYSYDSVNWISTHSSSGFILYFSGEGEKVYFRHNGFTSYYSGSVSGSWWNTFRFYGDCEVGGNIMSLYFGDKFTGQTRFTNEGLPYGFSKLFYNSGWLVSAEKLTFPHNCFGLRAYSEMFSGCVHLTTAPSSIQTPPSNYMMYRMFYGCTSLESAPELPYGILGNNAYEEMFKGCTSLNYVKAMLTTTPSSYFTYEWLSGVSASGTFVKNSNASWNVSGTSGVPSGWTVQTESPNYGTYQRISSASELGNGDTIIIGIRDSTASKIYIVPYTDYGKSSVILDTVRVNASYSNNRQVIVGNFAYNELVVSSIAQGGVCTFETPEGYAFGINESSSIYLNIVIGEPTTYVWTIGTNTSGSNQIPSNYTAFSISAGNNKCIGSDIDGKVRAWKLENYNNQNGYMLSCDIFRKIP